jgi:Zn-dependent protease with chaperone function
VRTVSGFFLLLAVIFVSPARSTQAPPSTAAPQSAMAKAAPAPEPSQKISSYTLPPALYQKAKTLGTIRMLTLLLTVPYIVLALWILLRSRLSVRFRAFAVARSRRLFLQSLYFTPLFLIAFAVLNLPLELFNQSLLKRYGISVQPWLSWLADWLKAQTLEIAIGIFLVWILFAVIRRSPRRWWFYFWCISVPILVLLVFIQPLVIDPMFNRFAPLSAKAPELIPQLQKVTERGGMPIPPDRMFWMLASDKTIYTNAYVTGLGASKRVVIWDTSLDQETTGGILTMFGHEMGHYALHHVWKGFVFSLAGLFVLFFLAFRSVGWLLRRFATAWGVSGVDDLAALPALLMLLAVFGFFAVCAGNSFSRYQEYQADIYSLEVTHGIVPDPGQSCAWSFQKFGEQVFVDPDPNPLAVALFYDHPTVSDRIRLCATYDPWSNGQSPRFVK